MKMPRHAMKTPRRAGASCASAIQERRVRRCGHATDGAERGSGTVLTIGLVITVLTVCIAVIWWAGAADAKHRAAAAADLSALAAADAARGLADGEPCQVAGMVAAAHHATLVQCAVQGAQSDTVQVTVSVQLPGALSALLGTAATQGRARAGPPSDAG